MIRFKFLLFFFFSMYGMQPNDTQVPEKVSQASIPNLVTLCLKRIRQNGIEQFNKKLPDLPTKLDDLVKEDIISGLIFPLSKITGITVEKHDTGFTRWPDTMLLTNKRLMLHSTLSNLLVIPERIRCKTKYFDLEKKLQITEERYTKTKEDKNTDKDILWKVTRENDALVLRFKNATLATKTILLQNQNHILFWDNKTISLLQKKKNHVFLLFYDLSPLTTLAATLTNLQNYKQALLLKTIIKKSKQGYFFDLTDKYYKSIYEAMPDEIKTIIKTLRTKK